MTRHTTQYYQADPTTMFAWADTDNDRFDRELDLYRLAQALEHHDHAIQSDGSSAGRGQPVHGMAATSITEGMYGVKSIPSWAYQDLSIYSSALANGAVTDEKLANDKVDVNGDTMLGDLGMTRAGSPTTGFISFGGPTQYIGFDGTNMVYAINKPAGGHYFFGPHGIVAPNGGLNAAGDGHFHRPGAPTTGYVFFGNGGAHVGFNGVAYVAGGEQIVRWPDLTASMNSVVNFPLGGIAAFKSLADVNALPARFTRFTEAEGRLLIGGGTTGGVPFSDGVEYGTPNGAAPTWIIPGSAAPTITYTQPTVTHTLKTPATPAQPSAGMIFRASGTAGTTDVSTAPHTHPGDQAITGGITLTGGGVSVTGGGGGGQWLPPMYCVHWARRNS